MHAEREKIVLAALPGQSFQIVAFAREHRCGVWYELK